MNYVLKAGLAALPFFAATAHALSQDAAHRVQRALAASSVASPALPDAAEAPPAKAEGVRSAVAPRAATRISLELTGVCRGSMLAVPGWCPAPGQDIVEPDGGITVKAGDEIELDLTVPLLWAVGRHAFVIVSAAPVAGHDATPALGEVVNFGVSGVRTLRFRADIAGEYRFLEPYGHALMGRLTVKP